MVKKNIIRRLGYVAGKLNVGTLTITKYLLSKGFKIENRPNFRITSEQFDILYKEFGQISIKKQSNFLFNKKESSFTKGNLKESEKNQVNKNKNFIKIDEKNI